MANYNTRADIILTVNGRQAEKMLAQLERKAKSLEAQILKAGQAGDKAKMSKLQAELKRTQKLMQQLQQKGSTVEQVLSRLDKATPRELNRALRTLQNQLNGLQRGSAAWDAQVAKIKMVKAELQKVNQTLYLQKSLWDRMNIALNNAQTFIMGVVAALTGLIMAGRRAVNAYADMEEQMANTRKYTRMTEEDVLALNEAFKGMNTRIARRELNELAQEAGRLGKNTIESVQGYVEAASIIKVALVDLGEGATQTIAKIANIFGMEELYGVKDAMLKVGSTVNVLSQNCTASKPYIVEFTQRMAGIGSTARMTIPEIMAFAATLDANGQKVEMSASALSRLIMKLFQQPAEVAKQVGLNVNYFLKVLNENTTKGVMLFLEQLNKLGEENALAALAPMFKDLEMDGVRMAQVLSNLSSHLDMLKWEMGEAATAFREGKSASQEYAIFNKTVQASIDKAKNRVHELAIELGEKLYPVMKHIYTSSGFFLRVLNSIVSFIIEYRKVIGTLVVSLMAYYTWVGLCKTAQFALNTAVALGTTIKKAYTATIGMAKVAIILFTEGTAAAKVAMQALNATLKASPWGLLISAVVAAGAAIYNLVKKTEDYKSRTEDAIKKASEFDEAVVKEQHELDILFGRLQSAEKGTKEYEKAKSAVINQYGKYLSGLISEQGEILNLEDAYNRLTAAIKRAAKERGINAAKEQVDTEYYKGVASGLNGLQASLEWFGMSAKDASALVTRVGAALSKGENISDADRQTINAYSAVRTGGTTGWQRFNSWMNNSWLGSKLGYNEQTPAGVMNALYGLRTTHDQGLRNLQGMEDALAPYRNVSKDYLQGFIGELEKIVKGEATQALVPNGTNNPDGSYQIELQSLTKQQAQSLIEEFQNEIAYRGGLSADNESKTVVDPYVHRDPNDPAPDNGKTDKFAAEKEWKLIREAYALIRKAQGFTDYVDKETGETKYKPYSAYDYQYEKDSIDVQFYEKILQREDLTWLERLQMQAKYQEALAKRSEDFNSESLERENNTNAKKVMAIRQAYADGTINAETYNKQLEDEEIRHLGAVRELYRKQAFAKQDAWQKEQDEAKEKLANPVGLSQEEIDRLNAVLQKAKPPVDIDLYRQFVAANDRYLQAVNQAAERARKEAERAAAEHQKKVDSTKKEYFGDNAVDKKAKYDEEMALLKEVYDAELKVVGDNSNEKLRIEEAYQLARLTIAKKYGQKYDKNMKTAFTDFAEWLESDGGKAVVQSAQVISQGLSNIFSEVTNLMKAELDIQTAAIEKRYDAEIDAAEGNSYTVKKLEKQKEKEIAQAKNEANRKMFVMQVIQAVAQTATNAIAAYGSAAAIPTVGWIMAPIAASMAVAAGMLQIAAIKKQQQASEASGYSEGGFTKPGRKDEPAGVVHAGEWVASQKLVNNPKTRPLINALDYAQKHNTIGSLTAADVSRSITAPMVLASNPAQPPLIVQAPPAPAPNIIVNSEYAATMRRLEQRLNEPFVTVNTVTGDHGIQRAQCEYDKLMKNKTPKSRK